MDSTSHIKQLVNQPESAGNYPLHAALRRLRRLWKIYNSPGCYDQLEPLVALFGVRLTCAQA
jgi:hypothetical protein